MDHIYAYGKTSYHGSEELTSLREGITRRMLAILTRPRGQTLDSLFLLLEHSLSEECEKIRFSVSSEGSDMLGSSHLRPQTLSRDMENWTPVKCCQSSQAFLRVKQVDVLQAMHSEGSFLILH